MFTIDADAHVIENESTWDYMLESEKAFKDRNDRRVAEQSARHDDVDYL